MQASRENNKQCRRLSRLTFVTLDGKPADDLYNLYLVAPLQSDFEVSFSDVRSMFHNSNRYNTFFFSEYNDLRGKCDFNTGIGPNRLGLLFTDTKPNCDLAKYNLKKNEYALVYLAESIPRATSCYRSFIEMVCQKYGKHLVIFQVVCPEWVAKEMRSNKGKIVTMLHKYYNIINIHTKDSVISTSIGTNLNENKSQLDIRGDVLPVPNEVMLGLIKNSVKDTLLTGDQSITDALSCCPQKNIFYQIAPWKLDLANKLAKYLPNKYLTHKKTSCGTLGAIRYNADYSKFRRQWDFRTLAKPLIDEMIRFVQPASTTLQTRRVERKQSLRSRRRSTVR